LKLCEARLASTDGAADPKPTAQVHGVASNAACSKRTLTKHDRLRRGEVMLGDERAGGVAE
jgi:hypothetical protein